MVTEKQILQSVTSITKYDSLLLQSAMVCCYIVRQLFNDKVRQLFSYKEWQVLLESVKSVFVNWTREMVSFELGKEIEKLVFRLVTSVGQRKKYYESPWGIEPQTFSFHPPMLYHWAIETPWWERSITKFIYDTRPAYCQDQDVIGKCDDCCCKLWQML